MHGWFEPRRGRWGGDAAGKKKGPACRVAHRVVFKADGALGVLRGRRGERRHNLLKAGTQKRGRKRLGYEFWDINQRVTGSPVYQRRVVSGANQVQRKRASVCRWGGWASSERVSSKGHLCRKLALTRCGARASALLAGAPWTAPAPTCSRRASRSSRRAPEAGRRSDTKEEFESLDT